MTSDSTPVDGRLAVGAPRWSAPAAPAPLVELLPERSARRALLAALAAGAVAQLLFVQQLAGINFVLWIALVLGTALLLRPQGARLDRADLWLPPSALAFAAFIGLRDDAMLIAFDIVATGCLTLAAVAAMSGNALTRGSGAAVARLAAVAVGLFWAGTLYLAPGARSLGGAFARREESMAWRVLRGVVIALPLVLVFSALFAAADAIFQAHLEGLLRIGDIGDLVRRLLFAAIAAWLFGGTLTCAWLARRQPRAGATAAQAGLLGSVEAVVVLVLLNAVFAIFVAVQAAYLFGGLDTLAVSGMTYSDYARRGFFELIAVAILSAGVILVLDRAVARRTRSQRVGAAVLAGLTGIVLVSALVRLGLYQSAYGWTELRFYALAAICWLALGVVATIAAAAVDRISAMPRFMIGTGIGIALVCNVIGPQALVTEQNVARALDPTQVAPGGWTGLDTDYLGELGADAVPVLLAARDRLAPDERAAVDALLRRHAQDLVDVTPLVGWPSWNLAREQARGELQAAGY